MIKQTSQQPSSSKSQKMSQKVQENTLESQYNTISGDEQKGTSELRKIPDSLLQFIQFHDDEDLNGSQISQSAVAMAQMEIGYFQTLNADFRSKEEEIRNNFLSKTKTIEKDLQSPETMQKSIIRHHIRELKNIITAYQFLSEEEERNKYINMIRLRSLASQHLNIKAALKDGYIYPFMIFSVIENSDNRMIEINFVENFMNDRFKDHISRSYHFSMIKKVIKGYKYDEFQIEFTNDKPLIYYASFPLQRDFIVEVINLAINENKYQKVKNKGINNPDNHNSSKKNEIAESAYVKTSLNLKFIMDDLVLPPKSIAKTWVYKKNQSLGYEKRFLLLGHSQVLIARDGDFNNIVNVIPLEGGYVMIQKPKDFPGLIIKTHQRDYTLKFNSPNEMVEWYHHLQSVVSKEIKIKKYLQRVKEQNQKLSNSNKNAQYQKIIKDIEEKLGELNKQLTVRKKFEKDNQKDEEFNEYMETVNQNSKIQENTLDIIQLLVGQNDIRYNSGTKGFFGGQNKNQFNNRDGSLKNMDANQSIMMYLKKNKETNKEYTKQSGRQNRKTLKNSMTENRGGGDSDQSDSDDIEYILHQEGNEEIHITAKARKQLKYGLLQIPNIKQGVAKKSILNEEIQGEEDDDGYNQGGQQLTTKEKSSQENSSKSSEKKRRKKSNNKNRRHNPLQFKDYDHQDEKGEF